MRRATWAAALTHAAFVAMFGWLGVWPMALGNLASIALYVVAGELLKRHRNGAATVAIVCEVLGHAGLAVVVVGVHSGFHLYLFSLVPPTLIGVAGGSRVKLLRTALLAAVYIGIEVYGTWVAPLHRVDPGTLAVMHVINGMLTFAILAFLSLNYYRLVVEAERALRRMATTDSLTGLFNRRHLGDLLAYEATQRRRQWRPMSVLLCDIDHFKSINDQHGHEAGDRVLQQVAQRLEAAVREQDAVGRWGGEEFLVLLPGTELNAALQVAERIATLLRGEPIGSGDKQLSVTMTIGAACHRRGESIDALVARADAALYRGKLAGRQRIVGEDDEQPTLPQPLDGGLAPAPAA